MKAIKRSNVLNRSKFQSMKTINQNRGEIKMKAKEALENIAVDFDTSGMVPTTLCDKNPDLHFADRYKEEMKVIFDELEKLKLYKEFFESLKLNLVHDYADDDFGLCKGFVYLEGSDEENLYIGNEESIKLYWKITGIEQDSEGCSEIDVSEFSDLVSDEEIDKMVDEMFPELHPAEEKEDKTDGTKEKRLTGIVRFITKDLGKDLQTSFNKYHKSDYDRLRFLYQDEYKWIAIDNTTGDAFTEEFDYLIEAINWLLKGENENE